MFTTRVEFDVGGKSGATESDDTGLAYAIA